MGLTMLCRSREKKLAAFLAMVLCLSFVGCKESPQDRVINHLQKINYCHDQMLKQWESIHDEASLKAASSKIIWLSEEEGKLTAELDLIFTEVATDKSSSLTDEKKSDLEQKIRELKKQSTESQKRFSEKIKSVLEIPGAPELVRDMLKARAEAMGEYQKYHKPELHSDVPSLQELDQQIISLLTQLNQVLQGVQNEADVSKAAQALTPIEAEFRECTKQLYAHHKAATTMQNPQQAASDINQLELLGKKFQGECDRIKKLGCAGPLFEKMRDFQRYLKKQAKSAQRGFEVDPKLSSINVVDEEKFFIVCKRLYGESQDGTPRIRPVSWDDFELKMRQVAEEKGFTWSPDYYEGIRNHRKNGYVVRWGTDVKEGPWYRVFGYTKEVPTKGGKVRLGLSLIDVFFTSPAGFRIMLLETILEEGFGPPGIGNTIPSNSGSATAIKIKHPDDSQMIREQQRKSGGFGSSNFSETVSGNDSNRDAAPQVRPTMRPRFQHPGAPVPGFSGSGFPGQVPPGFNAPNQPLVPQNLGPVNGTINSAETRFGSPENFPAKTPQQWADDLDATHPEKVYQAMYGLNHVDRAGMSSELKKQVARKAKDLAFDSMQFPEIRNEAVRGLVIWGGKYSIPLLVELLGKSDVAVQGEALKGLQKLGSSDGAEAAAKILAANGADQTIAIEYLESVGPEAEKFVLENVRPTTYELTQKTVELLGKIGTKKSFKAFAMLEKTPFNMILRPDIEKARQAILARDSK